MSQRTRRGKGDSKKNRKFSSRPGMSPRSSGGGGSIGNSSFFNLSVYDVISHPPKKPEPAAGAVFWFRADFVNLVGGRVDEVVDISEYNINLKASASAGGRPTYIMTSSAFNNKPAIQFTGAAGAITDTQVLTSSGDVPILAFTGANSSTGSLTIFTAHRLDGTPAKNIEILFSKKRDHSASVDNAGWYYATKFVDAGNGHNFFYILNQNADADAPGVSSTMRVTADTPFIGRTTMSGSDDNIYSHVTGTLLNNAIMNDNNDHRDQGQPIALGGAAEGGDTTDVTIAELIVYRRELTPDEIAQTEDYLSQRYNIKLDN